MSSARLTQESPLRAVFPDGIIPLARDGAEAVALGEGWTEQCFFLSLTDCTPEQRAAIAAMTATMGGVSQEDALAKLNASAELPVRVGNIAKEPEVRLFL